MLRVTTRTISSLPTLRKEPRRTTIRPINSFSPSRRLSSDQPSVNLITTPIFYVNSSPHIGHLYSALIADCLARWNRIKGNDVLLTTGTDEHGMKIQQAAEKAGISPQEFCDNYSAEFQNLFQKANISNDDFIRTTAPRHEKAVSEMWRRLRDKDLIYLGKYEGWYSVPDEAFLTEDQVTTIDDTVNGGFTKISIESGHRVDWVVEHNYRFKLEEFQQKLLHHYKTHPDTIVPNSKYNEVIALLSKGLPDLSISRIGSRVRWGLKVPDDPTQSVYVWLDALTNYLTVTGFPDEGFEKKWPAQYHVIGKDILKFHAIYWPAFLMGVGLPLPRKIVTHGHWTVNRVKMSKSLGNVISPETLFQEYGIDVTRYFLLAEGGITDDSDFSSERLKIRRKNDLSDAFGNFVLRCTGNTLLPGQKIPQFSEQNEADQRFINSMNNVRGQFDKYLNNGEISKGIEAVLTLLYQGNSYFQDSAPWNYRPKGDKPGNPDRLNTILYNAIECIRISSILFSCVMPDKMSQVLKSIGVDDNEATWENCQHGKHPVGRSIKFYVPFEPVGNST